MAGHRLTEATIDDEAALRERIGEPLQLTREKVADRLNALTRRFIELSPFVEVEGKLPKLGILVDIASAYTQCSKAFLRSHPWDPSRHVDGQSRPTSGQIHKAMKGETFDAEKYDEERAGRYARREGFY